MTDVLEPALPWDILREIAFNCPQKTCATLISTCTFFSHEAAASMLRNYVISLYDEFSTAGFVKFLRPGKRKKPRYPFVRHLALRYNPHFPVRAPLSPDTAKELADAFALMTGLVAVRIREYTMVNWPVIGDAISSLPSLRRIDMYEAGPRSCQSFLSLQSANLRSIQLNISDLESERAPWVSSHPVQLFGRWTSTLTELQYHSPFFPEVQYTPSCYPEVYPMMRTLSICHRGRVDLTPYIRAFPNLANLTVEILSRLDDEHEYRTSNIRSQREVQHLGPASKHPSWQELVQCNGFLVDLYALALSCRISHIRLDNYIEDDRHLPLLSAVLADARPIHLNIFGFSGILCHPTDSLSSVLRTQGASRLESLVVTCLIRECHQDHVASALSSLAASLAMLPGAFRRVRIDIGLQWPSSEGSAERQLAIAVDAEKILQEYVELIPTLEDAVLRYRREVVTLQQATFVRRGAVMRIGGTWVTDDPLDCDMFNLNR